MGKSVRNRLNLASKISTSSSNPTQNYFALSIANSFVYIIMRLKLKYIVLDRKDEEIFATIRIQQPHRASKMCQIFTFSCTKTSSINLFQPSVGLYA